MSISNLHFFMRFPDGSWFQHQQPRRTFLLINTSMAAGLKAANGPSLSYRK